MYYIIYNNEFVDHIQPVHSRIIVLCDFRVCDRFWILFEDDIGADAVDEMCFRRHLDLVPEFPVLKESHYDILVLGGHSLFVYLFLGRTYVGDERDGSGYDTDC